MSVGLYFASNNFISGRYSLLQLVFFFVFVSGGLFIFYLFFKNVKNDFIVFFKSFLNKKNLNKNTKDNIFLLLWLVGIILFNVLLISYASRYIILLVPVFIIFYIRILNNEFMNINLKRFLTICVISTFFLSTLMAIADYQLAKSYKSFAENYNPPENTKIWYSGHLGFQYYMDNKGYEILAKKDDRPKKRDIIIKSVLQVPSKFSSDLENRIKLIDKFEFENHFPVKVFNIDAHAGFYSYGAGFLPFSLSLAPLDTIEIYEVIN